MNGVADEQLLMQDVVIQYIRSTASTDHNICRWMQESSTMSNGYSQPLPAGSLIAFPFWAAQNGSVLGTIVVIKRCAGTAAPVSSATGSACSALAGMSTLCTAQTGSVLGTMLEMNRWAGTAWTADPGRGERAEAPARCSTESVLPIGVFPS